MLMLVTAPIADAPRYASIDCRRSGGPEFRSGTECSAVCGFSGFDFRVRFRGISMAQIRPHALPENVFGDRANAVDGSRQLWARGNTVAEQRSLPAATLRAATNAHEPNALWPVGDGARHDRLEDERLSHRRKRHSEAQRRSHKGEINLLRIKPMGTRQD